MRISICGPPPLGVDDETLKPSMAQSAEGSGEAGYRAIELGPALLSACGRGKVSDELTKTDCLSGWYDIR